MTLLRRQNDFVANDNKNNKNKKKETDSYNLACRNVVNLVAFPCQKRARRVDYFAAMSVILVSITRA